MCAYAKLALEKTFKGAAENAQQNLTQDGSVRTGLLQKAVDSKSIVINDNRGRRVWAAVGINSKVRGVYNNTPVKPTKYAHLVEYGHVARNGKIVPAKPFMRPAVAAISAGLENIVAEAIKEGAENALG